MQWVSLEGISHCLLATENVRMGGYTVADQGLQVCQISRIVSLLRICQGQDESNLLPLLHYDEQFGPVDEGLLIVQQQFRGNVSICELRDLLIVYDKDQLLTSCKFT